jgi:hypothetical protein
MSTDSLDAGLEQLNRPDGAADARESVTHPAPPREPGRDAGSADPKLEALLQRINHLTNKVDDSATATETPRSRPGSRVKSGTVSAAQTGPAPAVNARPLTPPASEDDEGFVPIQPESLDEAGLPESAVESLVLKFLLSRGDAAGRTIADQIRIPFVIMDELLRQMKYDQLLIYRDSAPMGDYVYQLTDKGRERARSLAEHCTYFGAAPVPLEAYQDSVAAQTLLGKQPTEADLKRAFEDLLINPQMLDRLGPAINSGRGLFLYGAPGNGKTSIAERVTKSFGDCIWVPRALWIDGEVMRLFDPMNHEEAPLPPDSGLLDTTKIDRRWVRIKRPTIVVGGELRMENLEVMPNETTGISEAPLQLKSNCGTLVIDDFGRQSMSTDELLNRWIVPLEKRYDFLNMVNGKKIQVPFDQLIVFSTNLEPKDLVDEAFLRRIPYKIEVTDPSEADFRELFRIMCPKLGLDLDESAVDYLVETHYRAVDRPFRACQPRDLLLQIRNYCLYQGTKPTVSPETFDFAVENYFAVM